MHIIVKYLVLLTKSQSFAIRLSFSLNLTEMLEVSFYTKLPDPKKKKICKSEIYYVRSYIHAIDKIENKVSLNIWSFKEIATFINYRHVRWFFNNAK